MSTEEITTHDEVSAEEGRALAMKLELLATVAQATLNAIMHVVDERRSGELNADQIEQVTNVRAHVEKALEAVDDYMERQGEAAIDLSGVRGRLAQIVRDLEERVPDFDSLPT